MQPIQSFTPDLTPNNLFVALQLKELILQDDNTRNASVHSSGSSSFSSNSDMVLQAKPNNESTLEKTRKLLRKLPRTLQRQIANYIFDELLLFFNESAQKTYFSKPVIAESISHFDFAKFYRVPAEDFVSKFLMLRSVALPSLISPYTLPVLKKLQTLERLTSLNVKSLYSSASNDLLSEISKIPKLRSLIFTESSGYWNLETLKSLKLEVLHLGCCKELRSDELSFLAEMPLQDFSVHCGAYDFLTNDSVSHFANLPLTNLSIASSSVDGLGLDKLKKCPLKKLELNGSLINDTNVHYIAQFPLQSLSIFHGRITDQALAVFHKLPLTELNLELCENIGDHGIQLLATLPLQKLNLRFTKITDLSFITLKNLPLRSLNVGYTPITDNAFQDLPKSLEEIELYNCRQLTDHAFTHIAQLPRLRRLNISGNFQFSAQALAAISALQLEYLNLEENNLSDEMLSHITQRTLTELNLKKMSFEKTLPFSTESVVALLNRTAIWNLKVDYAYFGAIRSQVKRIVSLNH
jgi:hypothetical protein